MKKGSRFKGSTGVAAERRLQAFELWKGGAAYRQVARQTGVSECQAWNDVQAVLHHLDEMEVHVGKEYRRAIVERDWGLILAAYPKALGGDLEAARLVILVHNELRDLLGLDAEKIARHELTGKAGEPLLTLDALDQLLAARRAEKGNGQAPEDKSGWQ